MSKLKPMLAMGSVVALMLLAGAGSAGFAQPQQQPGHKHPYVVGGTDVPAGKYPFIVALLDTTSGGGAFDQQFCGGTLIRNSVSVLTAAHCVDDKLASELRVVVGRTQLSTNQGQVHRIGRMYTPDGYNSSYASKNDVAVLKLASGTRVTGIKPAALAPPDVNDAEQPGRSMTIAGWGRTTSAPGSYSDTMQSASVRIASDADGAKSYPDHFVPELMIAAGGGNGPGTCFGDSGGPLFRPSAGFGPGSPPPAPATVYGITAFAWGCGDTDPTVFTEVNAPSIREFIVKHADEAVISPNVNK
jgi:secreted trypsin-like serine protease